MVAMTVGEDINRCWKNENPYSLSDTRDRIVGNGHILQWDLMSKINMLRS